VRLPALSFAFYKGANLFEVDRESIFKITPDGTGSGTPLSATRTVVLAFNRAGKPKAVKSTIKYETETE